MWNSKLNEIIFFLKQNILKNDLSRTNIFKNYKKYEKNCVNIYKNDVKNKKKLVYNY